MFRRSLLLLLGILVMSSPAFAALKTQSVTYTGSDGAVMEGYLAYDDAVQGPRPGILIAHDWMGLRQFSKDKAEQLAKQGYVAFAVDIYGKGVRPANAQEAGQLARKYKSDRALLRSHMRAAYDTLIAMKSVNDQKILVMGYCFGGTAALELARSGAPLAGTASFHGGLASPTPDDARQIRGRVLVMHGADDPHVPPAEVQAFKDEMNNAHVNMQFIGYPNAVHGFTNPDAGTDNSKGIAYNAAADAASWKAFEQFLKEVL